MKTKGLAVCLADGKPCFNQRQNPRANPFCGLALGFTVVGLTGMLIDSHMYTAGTLGRLHNNRNRLAR